MICLHLIFVGERWRLVLNGFGNRVSRLSLVKIVFAGQFFKQVLPSSILSDLAKIILCRRIGVRLGVAASSTIIDKIIGLSSLWLNVMFLTLLLNLPSQLIQKFILVSFFAISFYFFVIFISNKIAKINSNKLDSFSFNLFFRIYKAFAGFDLARSNFILLLIVSVAANALIVMSVYLIMKAIGVEMAVADFIIYIPLALVMSMIPISFGGWGVREASFIYVFSLNSLSNTDAVATSITYGLLLTSVSLLGGLFIPTLKKNET